MKKTSYPLLIAGILMMISSPVMAFCGILYSWMVHNRELADMVWILVYKSIVLLIAGIMGVLSWKKPERTKICFNMGIFIFICNGLYLLAPILTGAGSGALPGRTGQNFAFIVFVLNAPIPLLYLIAAYKFKKVLNQNDTAKENRVSVHKFRTE